jgi:hypothetical protein
MTSLRYDIDERGHMRPKADGDWTPYEEWRKCYVANHELRAAVVEMRREVSDLRIAVAIALAEAKSP